MRNDLLDLCTAHFTQSRLTFGNFEALALVCRSTFPQTGTAMAVPAVPGAPALHGELVSRNVFCFDQRVVVNCNES